MLLDRCGRKPGKPRMTESGLEQPSMLIEQRADYKFGLSKNPSEL
jgi:hypothetical protein